MHDQFHNTVRNVGVGCGVTFGVVGSAVAESPWWASVLAAVMPVVLAGVFNLLREARVRAAVAKADAAERRALAAEVKARTAELELERLRNRVADGEVAG
jgi:hypothetical protein